MNTDQVLRQHLRELLDGGKAHIRLEPALADIPEALRGVRPPGLPYSAWEQLEHMRIAMWDILEFSRNAQHVSPSWPEGYWPRSVAPPDASAWDHSVAALRADLQAMMDLVANPATDLFAPIPHGKGQTVLREAMLAADHLAYHLGQFLVLRRLVGAWQDEK
jgi:hypothetical protein